MTYLTDEFELLTLCHLHPRLKRLLTVRAKHLSKDFMCVDESFLEKFPLANSEYVYEAIGRNATSLDISLMEEKDFLAVIKHFPNITELDIGWSDLKDLKAISQSFPQTITKLDISSSQMVRKYRKALIQHVSPTLEELDYYGNTIIDDLLPLTKLKKLTIDIEGVRKGLSEVMKSHPDLKCLTVRFDDYTKAKDWTVLAKIENLTDLKVIGVVKYPLDLMGCPKFNHIDSISITLQGRPSALSPSVRSLLRRLGPQIKTILIRDEYEKLSPKFDIFRVLSPLPQLMILYLGFKMREDDEESVQKVCRLTSVQCLEYKVKCPEKTMQIVKGMPQLEILTNDLVLVENNAQFEKELSEYLREQGRTLHYNYSE